MALFCLKRNGFRNKPSHRKQAAHTFNYVISRRAVTSVIQSVNEAGLIQSLNIVIIIKLQTSREFPQIPNHLPARKSSHFGVLLRSRILQTKQIGSAARFVFYRFRDSYKF